MIEMIADYWDKQSIKYDSLPGHNIGTEEDRNAWKIILGGFIKKNMKVLDIGCGTGALCFLLHSMGNNVIGIDISEDMLSCARKKKYANEIRFEKRQIDEIKESFDCIISRNVFWTIKYPDEVLKRSYELLNPGGSLIIIDANWYDNLSYKNNTENDVPFDIKKQLPLIQKNRPESDLFYLKKNGFSQITIISDIKKELSKYLEIQVLNSFDKKIPQFLIHAKK